jgi:hypothetical protein
MAGENIASAANEAGVYAKRLEGVLAEMNDGW